MTRIPDEHGIPSAKTSPLGDGTPASFPKHGLGERTPASLYEFSKRTVSMSRHDIELLPTIGSTNDLSDSPLTEDHDENTEEEDREETLSSGSPFVQSVVANAWSKKQPNQKQKALQSLVLRIQRKVDVAPKTIELPLPDELRDVWVVSDDIEESNEGEIVDDNDLPSLTSSDISNAINIMTVALEDEDDAVRDAAFSLLPDMPREVYELLSQLLLTEDDEVLKLRLIEQIETQNDNFSILLLMQALDDDDVSVHDKAADRLGALFNLNFSSSQAAYDWWEQSHPFYEVENSDMDGNPLLDNSAGTSEGMPP